MNFAAFGELVAARARILLARDWPRHTDLPVLCPLMLRALARCRALGFTVETGADELAPPLLIAGFDANNPVHACAIYELLRHRKEAVEFLVLFNREERPSGPSGEQ